jgi:hypothetical protein
MIFIPAHRALSVDAWLRPALRADVAPAWCTWLLRAQIAIVYVNAGLAKATADWLLHAQPLNLWLSVYADVPVVGPYLALPAVAYAAAWAGFLFDTTIVVFLMWKRARPFAYAVVLAFHLGTHLLFPMIGMFPVIMIVAATMFFEAGWPRELGRRVGIVGGGGPPPPHNPRPPGGGAESWGGGGGASSEAAPSPRPSPRSAGRGRKRGSRRRGAAGLSASGGRRSPACSC